MNKKQVIDEMMTTLFPYYNVTVPDADKTLQEDTSGYNALKSFLTIYNQIQQAFFQSKLNAIKDMSFLKSLRATLDNNLRINGYTMIRICYYIGLNNETLQDECDKLNALWDSDKGEYVSKILEGLVDYTISYDNSSMEANLTTYFTHCGKDVRSWKLKKKLNEIILQIYINVTDDQELLKNAGGERLVDHRYQLRF